MGSKASPESGFLYGSSSRRGYSLSAPTIPILMASDSGEGQHARSPCASVSCLELTMRASWRNLPLPSCNIHRATSLLPLSSSTPDAECAFPRPPATTIFTTPPPSRNQRPSGYLNDTINSFDFVFPPRPFPGSLPSISCTSWNTRRNWWPLTSDVIERTSNSSLSRNAESIDSYRIIGTLGRGSHGKVFLVHHKSAPNGELYAMKVLKSTPKHNARSELAFLKLIATQMDNLSDGVVFLQRLLDNFEDDNRVYLLLEYHPVTIAYPEVASRFLLKADGRHRLTASISLPLAFPDSLHSTRSCNETLTSIRLLAAEISLGLLFLHNKGIVHQDIKPANVMISFAGHAVIGDLGAATRLPLGDRHDGYTRIVLEPGDLITFTSGYAAPELCARNLDMSLIYDERSDWWSFGVLLHELISGSIPFNTCAGHETIRRERRSVGDPSLAFAELEKLISGLPKDDSQYPDLDDFLRSLLVYNANDRLCGLKVRDHPFFDPISDLWDDIVALKWPPCTSPPIPQLDADISFASQSDDSGELESTYSAHIGHSPNEGNPLVLSIPKNEVQIEDTPSPRSRRRLPLREYGTNLSHCLSTSSEGSIMHPFPSSASIWLAYDQFRGGASEEDVHDSGIYLLPRPPRTVLQADNFLDDLEAPGLLSPFSLSPAFQQQHSLSLLQISPMPIPKCLLNCLLPPAGSDFSLPEMITMSLLEAMDNRDRMMGAVFQVKERPRKLRKGRSAPTTTKRGPGGKMRRFWKKLGFWSCL